MEARTLSKRFMGKSQPSDAKKSKKYHDRSTTYVGYSRRDRSAQHPNPRSPIPSVASAGSDRNPKPRCKHCNKFHFGECRMRSGACFRCSSLDHYIKDCPKRLEKDTIQTSRSSNPTLKGRPPRNPGNMSDNRGKGKVSTTKSNARAPARTYAIRAREDASTSDVIADTFSPF
ncbi:uncharacterized protein LOC105795953 [Gossypium raimondii]|uniref:uncharacterized protein LOC105795953 n=1 Tax=Gossypium raimondii TaxID=29730 RepID=UPI00063ABBF1|nr:uncharacterized protein LOC105795953 [Gossypium raimondii]